MRHPSAYPRRALALACLMVLLAACRLDAPEAARAAVARWLYPAEQLYFESRRSCTVAVFRLGPGGLRGGVARVTDLERALWHVGRGRAVLIDLPGQSPDAVSRRLMSRDLAAGLGLLSSALGPRDCMTERIEAGVRLVLQTQAALTIYDPAGNALILYDPGRRLAVFLRGNV